MMLFTRVSGGVSDTVLTQSGNPFTPTHTNTHHVLENAGVVLCAVVLLASVLIVGDPTASAWWIALILPPS